MSGQLRRLGPGIGLDGLVGDWMSLQSILESSRTSSASADYFPQGPDRDAQQGDAAPVFDGAAIPHQVQGLMHRHRAFHPVFQYESISAGMSAHRACGITQGPGIAERSEGTDAPGPRRGILAVECDDLMQGERTVFLALANAANVEGSRTSEKERYGTLAFARTGETPFRGEQQGLRPSRSSVQMGGEKTDDQPMKFHDQGKSPGRAGHVGDFPPSLHTPCQTLPAALQARPVEPPALSPPFPGSSVLCSLHHRSCRKMESGSGCRYPI